MTRFVVTGGTGLVGESLLLELLKHHLDHLDQLVILCLGRARRHRGAPLAERLRRVVRDGWQYLGVPAGDPVLDAAENALVPVEYDLRSDDLGLDAEARDLLAGDVDHFFHLAALTDFRHHPDVAERLVEVNHRGTERVLELAGGLSIGSFTFISSAYSCGLTYGTIAPDFIDLDRPFHNPYQRSKLLAEIAVREHFARRDTCLRVFRPSTVGGRLLERPTGYVNKYDVYLGWMVFFLRAKMAAMPNATWDELLARPMTMPIRIQANTEVGLNIVPADLVAKLIVAAALEDDPAESYHVVSPRDLPNGVLIQTLLERARVEGPTITRDAVEPANELERTYYDTVGGLYTPYLIGPEAQVFDATTMDTLCESQSLPQIGIDTVESLDLMLAFALQNRLGLF